MCHLTAGLFYNEIYQSPVDSKTYICSTHNEIFFFILKYLKCSINFSHSSVDFGGRLVNGSWNGILSLIDQEKADFIPHIFSNTNNRDRILDFQYLIPQKELLTMFSYPKARVSESPWNMFSSFSREIWILIGLFFIAYGGLNWFNEVREKWWEDWKGKMSSLTSNYFDMFALLLGQGTVPMSSDSRSILRNPLIIWLFAAFILRQLFASDITALLLSRGTTRLDSFVQLTKMGKSIKILVENQSSSYYIFKEKFPTLMPQTELISYDDVSSITTLQRVLHTKAILVCSREYGELVRDHYFTVAFHLSQEGFVSSIGNYAIRKSLKKEYKEKLSRLFRHIYYFGLTSRVDRTTALNNFRNALRDRIPLEQLASTSPSLLDTESSTSDLGRHTTRAFVYIYLIGIAWAVIVFMMEIIVALFTFV